MILTRPGRADIAAAAAAAMTMLVYAAQKAYMAAEGKIGMPGHVASAAVQARFEHAGLAQAANAGLGVAAALLALATVTRRGGLLPRWAMLGTLAVAAVMLETGALVTLWRVDYGSPLAALEIPVGVAQVVSWTAVVISYYRRSGTAYPGIDGQRTVMTTDASSASHEWSTPRSHST
ncbi:hypothetical protein [Actinomadura macrotermitis]|uniref:DUF998 domain-containing protein n=1 Tax=Actinomadura macrotermitis TaxID=2585200 RepID=A0A7K0BVQ9_9ACTN|nr:hypothetical protein [Actinomadura macrotermitis]MQY05258.1 hypothetical protein [Actinomadura macrotermitis]